MYTFSTNTKKELYFSINFYVQYAEIWNLKLLRITKYLWHNWNCLESIQTVWTVLKMSGQYWNRPDSIETVRTVSKLSGQCWNSQMTQMTELNMTKEPTYGQDDSPWKHPRSHDCCKPSTKLHLNIAVNGGNIFKCRYSRAGPGVGSGRNIVKCAHNNNLTPPDTR